jgi:hypothetical protein
LMKFQERRYYQTCPACFAKQAARKAETNIMRRHLKRHCPVVRQLKERCFRGQLTPEAVSQRIQEYMDTFLADLLEDQEQRGEVCDCVLDGTHFCERMVTIIDWNNEIVRCKVGRRCFIR